MRPPWYKLLAVVFVPPALFFVVIYVALITAGWHAFLSAMGHGSQSPTEYWLIVGTGFVVGVPGVVLVTIVLERWAFGPARARPRWLALGPWHTRAFSIGLAVILPLALPPMGAEAQFQYHLWLARRAGDQGDRLAAVRALGESGDRRALPVLRVIATTRPDGEDALSSGGLQEAAIDALPTVPGGKEALLELRASPDSAVRARVARGLLRFAADDDAWNAFRQIVESDPEPRVRLSAIEWDAVAFLPEGRRSSRAELLRGRLGDASPNVRVSAALRLGQNGDVSGYEAAAAIALDQDLDEQTRVDAIRALGSIHDQRAAPLLWRIVSADYGTDFIDPDRQHIYRNAAEHALGALFPFPQVRPEEYPSTWRNEDAAIGSVTKVIQAQYAYRAAYGSFEGRFECLETPSVCGRAAEPDDEGVLPNPALAFLRPVNGFAWSFVPGPPIPPGMADGAGASASGVATWAYVAIPVEWGRTGARAFCGDDRGRICYTEKGVTPKVRGGRCPESGQEPWSRPDGYEVLPGLPRPCQDGQR